MNAVEHYVGHDWRVQTHVGPIILDATGRILCVQFIMTSVWRLPEWPLYLGQDISETTIRAARWQVGAAVHISHSGSPLLPGPSIKRQVYHEGSLLQQSNIFPVLCRFIQCAPWEMPTAIEARRWIDPRTHDIRELDASVVEVGNRLRRR